jgi:tRNA pseudouridine55 synthase
VERAARHVTIYELDGELDISPNSSSNLTVAGVNNAYYAIKLIVKCSKGTYIRTLGEDIGDALHCGAHLSSLRRIGTGGFDVAQCVTLEALEAMDEAQRLACLLPVDSLLEGHTRVMLDADNTARFLNGVRRRGDWADGERIAVYGLESNALLGTADVLAGELIPGRLLSPQEIEQILQREAAGQSIGQKSS